VSTEPNHSEADSAQSDHAQALSRFAVVLSVPAGAILGGLFGFFLPDVLTVLCILFGAVAAPTLLWWMNRQQLRKWEREDAEEARAHAELENRSEQ